MSIWDLVGHTIFWVTTFMGIAVVIVVVVWILTLPITMWRRWKAKDETND